jgi:lipid A ethanolaminephosphotransferase
MAVKLFRETGRADLLDAHEARMAARRPLNPLWVSLALALWLASVGNLGFWLAARGAALPLTRGETLGLVGMLVFGSLALLAPLAWRGLIKWVAAALLLASALSLYALLFASPTPSPLVLNFLQYTLREERLWASPQLWLTLLLLGVLPAALLWQLRLRRGHVLTQLLRVALVAVLAAGGFLLCQSVWGEALRTKLQKQPELAAKLVPMNWRSQWPQAWLGPVPTPP